ncbi:LysM peptidoglycan-binding domain-containing protein [Paraliobacillus zengyii]|uniref:LysM peptidoglycan-binding domain-containing protein n=1 Tax=Paraliobacillus zengyii TaxID=2213194 RepID=UPI0013A6D5D2|nr:LysM peptidoglycan-binding domain-containing protein [Paraliobacillus zengyii]
MNNINRYELTRTDQTTDNYTLVIYLNDDQTEFAKELGHIPDSKMNLVTQAKQIAKNRYPNLKVSIVKVMIGGMVITAFPLMNNDASPVEAAELKPTNDVEKSELIYYEVRAGDSLWTISREFNTSIDDIKRANKLPSNTLQLNQQLIIPKAFHTIGTGDYLTVLAKNYQTSVQAIKEANGLTNDATKLGQTLLIPRLINDQSTTPNPVANTSILYTVVSGDSLSVIAKNNGTTVEALKSVNNLSTDILSIGQVIAIPSVTTTPDPVEETKQEAKTYTVVSGDSLSVIAKNNGTTVEALKSVNNLSTDILSIGQVIAIPSVTTTPDPVEETKQEAKTYTVVSGDSLSVIAKNNGTTVEALKSTNNLSTDILSIGQVIAIPSVTTTPEQVEETKQEAKTYTVVSGDSLSVIAKNNGTTVEALKSTNNLSTDILSIGQVLTIPSPTIEAPIAEPVEEVRSTFSYSVRSGDNLSLIANRFGVTVQNILIENQLRSDVLQVGQNLSIPNGISTPDQVNNNSITHMTHTVQSGDNMWNLSILYGIPQSELLRVNNLTTTSMLVIGQQLTVPVHNIAVKSVVSENHGEYLDWWTEAQYVFGIGKTATVIDFVTGETFAITRTIGANHADSETVTSNDSAIAKSVWGGYSWTPRAVLLEIDGRTIAASMSFMPHEREYIQNNGINGHFDVYFGNSTRHVDGKPDLSHQTQVEKAAGIR